MAAFAEAQKAAGVISIYNVWRVTAKTANQLLGGKAANLDAALALVDARVRRGEIPEAIAEQLRAETRAQYEAPASDGTDKADVTDDAASDSEAKALNIFFSDEDGIIINSSQIKAGLRECFGVQGFFAKKVGQRTPRQIFQHAFFVRGAGPLDTADNVHFYESNPLDGPATTLKAEDGVVQRTGHIVGAQGPRSIVTLNDFVNPGRWLQFDVLANDFTGKLIDEAMVVQGLTLLQDDGVGATRSQGFGRLEIVDFELIALREVPALKLLTDNSKPTTARKAKAKAKAAADSPAPA